MNERDRAVSFPAAYQEPDQETGCFSSSPREDPAHPEIRSCPRKRARNVRENRKRGLTDPPSGCCVDSKRFASRVSGGIFLPSFLPPSREGEEGGGRQQATRYIINRSYEHRAVD